MKREDIRMHQKLIVVENTTSRFRIGEVIEIGMYIRVAFNYPGFPSDRFHLPDEVEPSP